MTTWPRPSYVFLAQQLARQAAMPKRLAPDGLTKVWSRVDRMGGPDACWPWIGQRKAGYGSVRVREWGASIGAHRATLWVAEHVLADPDRGEVTRHLCHNKACCNPAHLLIGTLSENKWDDYMRSTGVDLVAVRRDVEARFRGQLEALVARELQLSHRRPPQPIRRFGQASARRSLGFAA